MTLRVTTGALACAARPAAKEQVSRRPVESNAQVHPTPVAGWAGSYSRPTGIASVMVIGPGSSEGPLLVTPIE